MRVLLFLCLLSGCAKKNEEVGVRLVKDCAPGENCLIRSELPPCPSGHWLQRGSAYANEIIKWDCIPESEMIWTSTTSTRVVPRSGKGGRR